MAKRTPAFIGLDIETTGLDPNEDVILEVGVVIFDAGMTPMGARSWLIRWENASEFLPDMAPAVREMHRKSGLAEDMRRGRGVDLREAELQAIEFIRGYTPEKIPMLGASITLDRSFLAEFMPALLDTFHYRSLDATSVKLAALTQASGEGHREFMEAFIRERADRIRSDLLEDFPHHSAAASPHRPIYDICSSAALAQASIDAITRARS